jgi:hypothetical protein
MSDFSVRGLLFIMQVAKKTEKNRQPAVMTTPTLRPRSRARFALACFTLSTSPAQKFIGIGP